MKKILASLLAAYIATNGQQIPTDPATTSAPGTPALISMAQTTQAAATTSSPGTGTTAAGSQTITSSAPLTTAPATTASAQTITSSAPVTTLAANTAAATTQAPLTTTAVQPAQTTQAANPVPPLPVPPVTPLTTAVPAPGITAATGTTAAPGQGTPVNNPPVQQPATNPFCGTHLQTLAQQSMFQQGGGFASGYQMCTSYVGPGSIATDFAGQLEIVDGGGCMCSDISCGYNGIPCDTAQFGDFAAIGNQNIRVKGSLSWQMGNIGQWQQGAQIQCGGQQSCRAAKIVGELIGEMQCNGFYGCNEANIIINDPAPQFNLNCDAEGGCAGANIEINIRNCATFVELGQLQFNQAMSASGAIITINNYCTTPVIVEHLDCQHQGSCQGTQFRFNGAVQIQNCEIFGATSLPPQCLGFGGGFGLPQFPQPAFNPYPQFPQPLTPVQQPQQPQTPPQIPPQAPPQLPTQTPPQAAPQPPAQVPPQTPPQLPAQTPAQLPAQTPAQTPPQTPAQVPPQTPPQQQPQTPPLTPGFPSQGFPPQQAQPGFGFPQFGAISALGGQCEFPGQCGGIQRITAMQQFELNCVSANSCGGLQLTLDVQPGAQLQGFTFEEMNAANGATITINSVGGFGWYDPVEINRITCERMYACNGLTINAGQGIDLSNIQVECMEPPCGGSINGMSLDMLSNNQGNQGNFNPGFGFPSQGFPQPQQPGFPQQPQQPGIGQGQGQTPVQVQPQPNPYPYVW